MAILWSSIEDYAGLWEVAWELNTLHKDNTRKKNKKTALEIVYYLFSKEMIEFKEGKWGGNEPMRPILDKKKLKKILEGKLFWTPPESLNSNYISISSTKKGEEYYKSLYILVNKTT